MHSSSFWGSSQMNEYETAVMITFIIHDYFLVFSREVDYVWSRPWTWVSTIFVLVRYAGLASTVFYSLQDSVFPPGTVKVSTAMYAIYYWGGAIFLNAADLVMILCVYAMWNRSKSILYILLFIYVPQVIVSFIYTGAVDNPNTFHLSVTTVQVGNFNVSSCIIVLMGDYTLTQSIHLYDGILRLVLSIALLILAVIQTLKQSVDMYNATKQWQLNQYMQQLIRDGSLYFLIYVVFTITIILNSLVIKDITSEVFLNILSAMAITTMMPRFIIGIRELYDRDLQRNPGRSQGIDTGFSVLSQPAARGNAVVSAIAFADIDPGQGEGQVADGDGEDSEVIQLEVLGDGTRQVVEGDADDSDAIQLVISNGACQV
ncbi:hypothetical protein OG21DRAFT_837284 [Imleria badia]|nr:hypothetical protein OG21DRAFT_837284 [Imleria badia]